MDHNELLEQINNRLDRVEKNIREDLQHIREAQNENDTRITKLESNFKWIGIICTVVGGVGSLVIKALIT